MTPTSEELQRLLERVEGASGPDREIDYALEEYFVGDLLSKFGYKRLPGDNGWDTADPSSPATKLAPAQEFTADVNYLIGLIDRKLPGSHWRVEKTCERPALSFRTHPFTGYCGDWGNPERAEGPTPTLALCKAFLRALIQKENGG